MQLPNKVKIVEVGPRDGLQNEPRPVPIKVRIELIDRLVESGLTVIECGSFVSPRWVPQMAGSGELLQAIGRRTGVSYPVLVPNLRGLENALTAGAREVAVFAAASESFSRHNINGGIDESLERYGEVITRALDLGIRVRGYVSCVLGCPFEGEITPSAVARVASRLYELGCYEISLGDTVGVGTPLAAQRMVGAVAEQVPISALAAHFHDTYGQALANLFAVMQMGVAVIDSSVAGLGGCPYAPGASGNVATEEVLYMLDGMGITTAVDLPTLLDAGRYISAYLGKETQSRVAAACASKLPK
ncbi:MAG: hydroxymethylglutaryl-CoA lyase [Gammaproteobacteria bacterium]|nr:hydroxymethylglutaryl-CoA lyase [Gammaproteobacteria bacterium]